MDIRVLLRIDNQTAIVCINKGGSVKYESLNEKSQSLWLYCETRNIELFASLTSSSNNIIADHESRIVTGSSEYELNDTAFKSIIDRFGKPEVDLFASRIDQKCDRFMIKINHFMVSRSGVIDSRCFHY